MQPTISLKNIEGKELFIPIYVRDRGKLQVICLPISHQKLMELLSDYKTSINRNNLSSYPKREDFSLNPIPENEEYMPYSGSLPSPKYDHSSLPGQQRDNQPRRFSQQPKTLGENDYYNLPPGLPIHPINSSSPDSLFLSDTNFNGENDNHTNQILRRFLHDCCRACNSSIVSRNELQEAYQKWSISRRQPHIAGNVMASYFDQLYKTIKIKKKVHYVGLSLK